MVLKSNGRTGFEFPPRAPRKKAPAKKAKATSEVKIGTASD